MIKTIIRQWLCQHKNTVWVREERTTVSSFPDFTQALMKPEVTCIKNWFKCKDCEKSIKIVIDKLLE